MSTSLSTLVAIATYNEIENLPNLVDEILKMVPDVDILVIDDNSPDGTGKWCKQRASQDSQLKCIHRATKLGLGTATVDAFQFAIDNGYEYLITMDADFSHRPHHLPALREAMTENTDVVIGSRYVKHGGVQGWPLRRRLMSRGINTYARLLLGIPCHDCSGAFRCYRTDALRRIDLTKVQATGYAFCEEILWRLKRVGAQFVEVPIVFVDRQYGQSKINLTEAIAALRLIAKFGLLNLVGRQISER